MLINVKFLNAAFALGLGFPYALAEGQGIIPASTQPGQSWNQPVDYLKMSDDAATVENAIAAFLNRNGVQEQTVIRQSDQRSVNSGSLFLLDREVAVLLSRPRTPLFAVNNDFRRR